MSEISPTPTQEQLTHWRELLQAAWNNRERALAESQATADKIGQEFAAHYPDALESAPLDAIAVLLWNLQSACAWRTGKPAEAISLAVRAEKVARTGQFWVACARALLNQGIGHFYQSNYTQAIELVNQAKDLFAQHEDAIGLASSLNALGNLYRVQNRLAEAVNCQKEALRIYQELNKISGIISVLNNLGTMYLTLQEDVAGIDCLAECIALCREHKDTNVLGFALNNMGTIHERLGKFADALRYHEESLAVKQTINDLRGQAISLNNIGICQQGLGQDEDALVSQNKAHQLFLQIKDRWGEAYCLEKLGELADKRGDYAEARRLVEGSITIRIAIGDSITEAQARILLANHVLNLPDTAGFADFIDYAFDHLQKALPLTQLNQTKATQLDLHTVWYKLCKRLGQTDAALRECELVLQLEREVQKEKSEQKLQHITMLYELETARRKAEIQQLRSVELANLLAETERQREVAQEANQFKSDLLAIAAHDLRNPLSGIVGFTELLEEHIPASDADGKEFCQLISSSSRNMFSLINDLLDSSEIDSDGFNLRLEPIDLTLYLQDIVHAHNQAVTAKQQQCEITVSGHCVIQVDLARFRQMIDNLVTNAIKYTPTGQRFWVRASPLSTAGRPEVVIEVGDTGQGLTPVDMEQLFKQFKRLSARPTAGEYSTGLGLSIVKRLVDAHNGRIWATSAGAGQGSRFYVALPAAEIG